MSVTVDAPAKLTLRLAVTGTRPDGLHLIDAEMVTLSLCDRLVITPADGETGATSIAVTGEFADGVPTGAGNLVARALQLAQRSATISIDKQIPHGGGLGGGSSDAAAVLRWAGFDDLAAAAALGADIAFCLVGGRARVTGIGEVVEPLPHRDLDVTLIIPPLQVSTPAAYRAFDQLDPGDYDGYRNQLEPAAIAVEPRLTGWRDAIADACGITPTLAGSGATWFVEGRHANALAALRHEGARIHEASTRRPQR